MDELLRIFSQPNSYDIYILLKGWQKWPHRAGMLNIQKL